MRDRALRISRLASELLAGPSADLAATAGLLAQVGLLLPHPACVDETGTVTPPHVAGVHLLGLRGLPPSIVEAVAFYPTPSHIHGFWVTGAVSPSSDHIPRIAAPLDDGGREAFGQRVLVVLQPTQVAGHAPPRLTAEQRGDVHRLCR